MGIFPTTIQNLKQKVTDLKILLDNEKSKRTKDCEEFAYKCGLCIEKSKHDESVILMLQRTIADYSNIIEENERTICAQKKRIEDLEDRNAVLDGRLKKDSTNSSKPPSSDGFKKQTFSTRKKSEKKPGGQEGHAGRTLSVDTTEAKIVDRKEGACPCGGEIVFGEEYQSRSVIDIVVTLSTTEERSYSGTCKLCCKPFRAAFSSEFRAPIQYGNNINTLTALLNEYGNVADKKTADIVSSICGNNINMSAGTVVNIRTRLSERLNDTVEYIKQMLTDSNILGADETGVRVNGKLNWVHIFCNDMYTLFEHNSKRSAHCNDVDGILALFTGILVHDHLKSYYKNKIATHSECNQHILRYLESVIQIQIQTHEWAKEMTDFLISSKKRKEELIASGKYSFPEEELAELEERYISILNKGDKEYQAAIEGKKNIKRFDDERRLLARLREYKDEHLRFLSNFLAPFGNHAAEQGAHFIKGKIKVYGGFRSAQGAGHHMKIASVIASAKKQRINPYSAIKNAFDGLSVFDNS